MIRILVILILFHCTLSSSPLSHEQANTQIAQLIEHLSKHLKEERREEFSKNQVKHGDITMRYGFVHFGEEEQHNQPLFISMHGGGGAPAEVNDRQWRNQIKLYDNIKEGYYLAPRAPTNTWNLWHQAHIDPLFNQLIENFILFKNIDPNRIYLLGYSAGGDGVYQLAPRTADRFAAAAMMAGHPNEAKPDNLANLPFFLQCGGRDTAYKRNEIAQEWTDLLQKLHAQNPSCYNYRSIIYPNKGHWMNGEDKVAIPWMEQWTRNPWPKKIVWAQDDVLVHRFYWLECSNPQKGQRIEALVNDQTIHIKAATPTNLKLLLSDELLDLDKIITVIHNGNTVYQDTPSRNLETIQQTLKDRFDPAAVATATLSLKLD